ncbi:hypothetical protein QTH97_29080 [Variovorax sp. J22R24]|uniref:hypothetical protein n=1 Tax=Variovorax gracilis TaxID=3053502 RepID=UPI00257763AC|nr:hypothetical protein [Variovorax sp. J22R24]MDM0109029.1 hypothetical protein [Variovorax sp. J22R24]
MKDLKRALVAAVLMAGLAGCGGGGGGGGSALPPVSGGGSDVKPAPDARNGDFKFFAANGTRQSLKIDFDQLTYTVTDNAGGSSSGTLDKPAAPTARYGVRSGRITTQANTSGLFAFNDTVVGSVPLAVPNSNPVSYAPYPFIASRALVTAQANLDGVYNRFRVDSTPTGRDSFIGQVRISGGGTTMTQCVDSGIYRVEKCPVASVSVSAITADAEAGMWNLTGSDGTFQGRFAIGRVEGENVYLSAGSSPNSVAGTWVFSIGFPEASSWSAFKGVGGSTGGTMDTVVASATSFSITSTTPETGTQTSADFALHDMGAIGPLGMRGSAGPGGFFFMRMGKLEAMVGARGNVNTAGFLHLGVVN